MTVTAKRGRQNFHTAGLSQEMQHVTLICCIPIWELWSCESQLNTTGVHYRAKTVRQDYLSLFFAFSVVIYVTLAGR